MYHLSYPQLAADVLKAYQDAKRHKSGRHYVIAFEKKLQSNLQVLTDELWQRTYRPRPGTCFIITEPKKREVFAADFRDRIVHHLYYNYTHELYERTFIADSYSCILHRGTHYGINRLEQHSRSESRHYGRYVNDFYVVSCDKAFLRSLVPQVRSFLKDSLSLSLHEGKTQILPVQYGVTFLGMFLKPWRRTASRSCLQRMEYKYAALLQQWHNGEIPIGRVASAVASFRGVLSHGKNADALRMMTL